MYIHRGATFQRGHGLGNVFRGLFNFFAPMVKSGAKRAIRSGAARAIKKSAKKAIVSQVKRFAGDVLSGENVASSGKKRMKMAKDQIYSAINAEIVRKPRPTSTKRQSKRKSPIKKNKKNKKNKKKNRPSYLTGRKISLI